MSLDVQALRESFDLVVAREPQVAARFYTILFERYPQTKRLFGRHSEQKQQEMLTGALVAVVEHLEDSPWLVTNLRALGERHAAYDVTPEMYGWVGECLVATLAEVASDQWSDRYSRAWGDAYAAITQLTLAGYPQA